MRRQASLSVILACQALLALPATAESLHLEQRGVPVVGSFELGQVHVPLPAGRWTLAGRGEVRGTESAGIVRIGHVYLVEIVDGQIARAIWASAPLRGQGSGYGWTRDKGVCDRSNTFVNESDSSFNSREQRCWSVNHFVSSAPNNPNDPLKDFLEFLAERRLDTPPIRIVTEHSVNDSSPFLRAVYYFNPATIGISLGPFERWDSAEWNKTRVSAFPEKLNFLKQVEVFGREMQKLVLQGLRSRLEVGKPIDLQVAGWPVPAQATVPAPVPSLPNATPQSSDPAQRLKSIDDLKTRGLINEAEYQTQRKRILDGL